MSIFPFGSGKFYFQRARAGGYIRAGIATLQDGAVSIEQDIKELYGAQRFPVDIRTGKGKISGTIKHVDWNAPALALVLGETVATGGNLLVPKEAATVPASPAYTVTVTNSGTFFRDVQVVMNVPGGSSTLVAGQVFTQHATTPAAGVYTVSNGVYTFAAADAGATIFIAYLYTATTGEKIAWSNKDIGTTPVCRGIFQGIHSGGPDNDQVCLELDYCCLYNWKSATKVDDWTMIDQAFSAFAHPDTGTIGQISFSKAA